MSETTIMKIGGWKTPAVFKRYDIVDEADLADAAQRRDEKRERVASESATGTGVETRNKNRNFQGWRRVESSVKLTHRF